MLFIYKAYEKGGAPTSGSVEAVNLEAAINSLQRRGFTIASIQPAHTGLLAKKISFFDRVKSRDVVLVSRQMSTLFEAQVPALRIFRLLAEEAEGRALQSTLAEVADDLQSGSSISRALAKHPKAFSDFYVSMVRAGEEAGKLDETFVSLADNLERTYEVTSKARSALIYPAFVIVSFIAVMVLMLTKVIPNLSTILRESGQEVPIYTRVVMAISDLFVNYGLFVLVFFAVAVAILWWWGRRPAGKLALARFKISVPYLGMLYRKLYLSRIAENLNSMLAAAIPIVKTLEITAAVVGNAVYEAILRDALEAVKSGSSLSAALGRRAEIPGIMSQMIKVGEESGELGSILKTLARFYQREVSNAVDTMVSLIEPVLVIMLGLGVGFLLAAVLIPIYNIAGSIS